MRGVGWYLLGAERVLSENLIVKGRVSLKGKDYGRFTR